MDILNETPDFPKTSKIPQVYSKCNRRYVTETDYWSIGRVIRCSTNSEITRIYVNTWRHCMQMVTIKQYLIKCINHIWIKL